MNQPRQQASGFSQVFRPRSVPHATSLGKCGKTTCDTGFRVGHDFKQQSGRKARPSSTFLMCTMKNKKIPSHLNVGRHPDASVRQMTGSTNSYIWKIWVHKDPQVSWSRDWFRTDGPSTIWSDGKCFWDHPPVDEVPDE